MSGYRPTVSRLSSSFTCTVGPYLLIYDTVGLYPLIYLCSGHHPRHLLHTNSIASFPLLLAQWAHTSSFYDTVGIYPLIYLCSGHHPERLDSLCIVDGEGGAHCVCKRVGICPLCHKMRRYGPTVQVWEELRLDSL